MLHCFLKKKLLNLRQSCNPLPPDFSKPWYRITLKYYSYLTYKSLLAKELSLLLLDSQVKAKWANFPVLNLYKCKPKGFNEITYINSILYFKMSLLNVHICFCVFVFEYWVVSSPFMNGNIFWLLNGLFSVVQMEF